MNGRIVIALYRPHAGKRAELEALLASHVTTLQELELATDRAPVHARAEDGTYMEIFEWRSENAARQAHEHPAVARVWEAIGSCCELPLLATLPEAQRQFPHFVPLEIGHR